MSKFLLRFGTPESLKKFGLRLLIASLIAEAIVIILVPSGALEKALNTCFTLMIALGIWIEEIGDHAISLPRRLTAEAQKRVADRMRSFNGLRAVLGAVPPSANNVALIEDILRTLKDANVDAFINLNGVEASISPTGQSNRGRALANGIPLGVTMHFVSGNSRGRAFAETLAQALIGEKIAASAIDDSRTDSEVEHWISGAMKEGVTLTRESKEFEPVTVAVGDKP